MTTYSQTCTSKARILPPSSFQTLCDNNARTLSTKLEVQWDGITWTNESSYLLSVKGNVELSGPLGEASSAQIDVEVDNVSDRFSPKNKKGALYGYFEPRVPIRVSVSFGDSDYYVRLFTGYIKTFSPISSTKITNFHCFDNAKQLLNKEAPYDALFVDKRIDELILSLIQEAGVTEYSLDEATQVVAGAWFDGNKLIHPLVNELTIAERGRSFFDANGRFCFWNKNRLHNPSPLITLTRDKYVIETNYEVSEDNIKNKITVEATPRGAMGSQQVWSNVDPELADITSDSLVYIPANTQQSAWVELEDPATSWVQPIANTDFTANSAADGSGDDLTSDVSVSTFNTYATSAFLTVKNSGSTDAYLTKFSIRANPVKIYKWIRIIAKDENSIEDYGVKDVKYENSFIDSESQATDIAYEELERWKSAINTFPIKIKGVPYLYTGDIVSVEVESGRYEEYMVNKIDWEISAGNGYTQTLELVNKITIPTQQTMYSRACIT